MIQPLVASPSLFQIVLDFNSCPLLLISKDMFPPIQGRSWAELFIDLTVLKTFIGWAASVLCSLTRAEMIYCIIPRSLVTVVAGRPPTLTCPRRGDV